MTSVVIKSLAAWVQTYAAGPFEMDGISLKSFSIVYLTDRWCGNMLTVTRTKPFKWKKKNTIKIHACTYTYTQTDDPKYTVATLALGIFVGTWGICPVLSAIECLHHIFIYTPYSFHAAKTHPTHWSMEKLCLVVSVTRMLAADSLIAASSGTRPQWTGCDRLIYGFY